LAYFEPFYLKDFVAFTKKWLMIKVVTLDIKF
jgi:hypothetical protein